MLHLVPHLLLQTYCVLKVRSNPALCAAPLLAHPLTAQRIHAFHAAMRLLSVVLPGGACVWGAVMVSPQGLLSGLSCLMRQHSVGPAGNRRHVLGGTGCCLSELLASTHPSLTAACHPSLCPPPSPCR